MTYRVLYTLIHEIYLTDEHSYCRVLSWTHCAIVTNMVWMFPSENLVEMKLIWKRCMESIWSSRGWDRWYLSYQNQKIHGQEPLLLFVIYQQCYLMCDKLNSFLLFSGAIRHPLDAGDTGWVFESERKEGTNWEERCFAISLSIKYNSLRMEPGLLPQSPTLLSDFP